MAEINILKVGQMTLATAVIVSSAFISIQNNLAQGGVFMLFGFVFIALLMEVELDMSKKRR